MEKTNEVQPATAAPAPTSTLEAMNSAFADALKQEGIVKDAGKTPAETTTAPAAAPAPAPAQAKEPEAAPERSWERLIEEKAALRKQQEALKSNPNLALQGTLDAGSAQALLKAKQAGDPMGVLTALGFTYNDVVKRILETESAAQKAPAPPEPKQPETSRSILPPELESEINQMRAYVMQQQRKEILSRVKEALPADKFKMISSLGQYEGILQYVQDFHARTGELPGSTFEESITTAAEALERHLSREAEKWKKVLTPAQTAASIQPEAQREPPQHGQETVSKTLTNSVAAPAPTKPELKSRDEVISDLLKDPEFLNSL